MESHVVQFPSRAFAHVAPPWAQALHPFPAQFTRPRSSFSSDDLLLTENDLETLVRSVFADEGDAHGAHQHPR